MKLLKWLLHDSTKICSRCLTISSQLSAPLSSKLPEVNVPDVSVHQMILTEMKKRGNFQAFKNSANSAQFTSFDVADRTARIRNSLQSSGIGRGDIVIMCLQNCPEYPMTSIGAFRAGATLSTINPMYTSEELQSQFEDCRPSVVITSEDKLPNVMSVASKLDFVKKVYVIGRTNRDGKIHPFDELFAAPEIGGSDAEDMDLKNDPAFLPYSSGTTGRPKGVILTHRNVVAQLACLQLVDPEIRGHPGDKVLAVLPFFHCFGFMTSLRDLTRGITAVTMPQFNPDKYLRCLQDEKITYLYAAPPMMLFLAKSPEALKYDLSSINTIMVSAAPVSQEIVDIMHQRFPSVRNIVQGWGMSEITMAGAIDAPSYTKPIASAAGLLISGFTAKIVDLETDEELGPNKRGEFLLKGPSVMKGYLNREEETKNAFTADGYLRTGDIALYDEEERIYIVDRKKELIKVKGFQVAPAELEDLLLSHPDIKDAAVIGIPDERTGEAPCAFVAVNDSVSKKPTEDQIKNFVKDRVAAYKQLTGGVHFLDKIPKSPAGKILRKNLRKEYAK